MTRKRSPIRLVASQSEVPPETSRSFSLPRGVHLEGFTLGDTRTLIIVDSQGIVLRRCTVPTHLADAELMDDLSAWLDRVDPITAPKLVLV